MSALDLWQDRMGIRTLRMRGGAEQIRSRQRIESVVSVIATPSSGARPRELLVVRRVAPAVALSLDSSDSARAFRSAVEGQLSQCAANARRPWLHVDASTTDAVLFADEAELVACLVRDWLRGWVAERWWWRSVLWNLSVQEWLRRHVVPRGESLVSALSLLAASSDAVGWMRELDDAEAEQAISSIVRAYALLGLEPSIPTPPRPPLSHDRSEILEIQKSSRILETQFALERLSRTVPEARALGLGAPQRRLLTLALVLTRAPAWARSAEFAAAWELLDHTDPAPHIRATTITSTVRRSETLQHGSIAPTTDAAPVGESTEHVPLPSDERERTPAPTIGVPGAVPLASSSPHSALRSHPVVDSLTQATEAAPPSINRASAEPVAEDVLPTAATEFGGLFYLLNAALALGLYGDFTAPRASNLALSPWNWLALIGRSWFGAGFESDPLWRVLASLAGRSADEQPDHEFVAPTTWIIDPTWLEPWGRVPLVQFRSTRTRLQVLHPAGFVLFDVPRVRRSSPAAQVRHLCRAFPSLRDAAIAHATGTTRSDRGRSGTARWMEWLLPYLEARLARSLGVEPDAMPALVCRHDAKVVWSLASVDVYLSLAALPLAIRIAGLDRDPGWIPAAGRLIAFHFE